MDESNFSGGDEELRTPTLIWGTSNSRRRSRGFSWRIKRVSSTTSRLTSRFPWSDKWLLVHVKKLHIPPPRWTQSQTLLAERRINHSLFHWSILTFPELQEQIWMLNKNAALTTIGTSIDQETCLIHGQVSLNLFDHKRNLQTDIRCPEWDWQNGRYHPGQIIYDPELWIKFGRTAKLKEKHKWSDEKQKLDNARRLEEFISLTLRTRNSKKLLECQWKVGNISRSCYALQDKKQNVSMERQDCGWENLYQIIMKTILQERWTIHCSITIWYTILFLCLKAKKIPEAKAAVDKNGRKWKRFRRGTWR